MSANRQENENDLAELVGEQLNNLNLNNEQPNDVQDKKIEQIPPNNEEITNDRIPHYLDRETYLELYNDPKERLLIWNRLRHSK